MENASKSEMEKVDYNLSYLDPRPWNKTEFKLLFWVLSTVAQ